MDGEISTAEVKELLEGDTDVRIVDIRDERSFERSHIPKAKTSRSTNSRLGSTSSRTRIGSSPSARTGRRAFRRRNSSAPTRKRRRACREHGRRTRSTESIRAGSRGIAGRRGRAFGLSVLIGAGAGRSGRRRNGGGVGSRSRVRKSFQIIAGSCDVEAAIPKEIFDAAGVIALKFDVAVLDRPTTGELGLEIRRETVEIDVLRIESFDNRYLFPYLRSSMRMVSCC